MTCAIPEDCGPTATTTSFSISCKAATEVCLSNIKRGTGKKAIDKVNVNNLNAKGTPVSVMVSTKAYVYKQSFIKTLNYSKIPKQAMKA